VHSAFAAEPPRLAILVSPGDGATEADLERFRAQVAGGILAGHKYILVDRARLSAVLREQGLSNSAYADPSTAAQLGKIIGASRILYATLQVDSQLKQGGFVNSLGVSASSSFEMLDVSTAQIRASGIADGSSEERSATGTPLGSGSRTRRAAIDQCADELLKNLETQ
jgi:hypothetical protein